MAKWVKSYPEAAGRFAVSIVDAESPTGFSWSSSVTTEVKNLLGLPKNIYVAKWYQSGTSDPTLSSLRINTFSTSPIVQFIRDAQGQFAISLTGVESASIADIDFRDMDEDNTRYLRGGYIGANPYLYVFDRATNNHADGFTIMITIKQWT